MSRKPKTQDEMPTEEDRTDIPDPTDRPTGRRFVSGEVLEIERELVAEGVDLPNRGIPSQYERRVKQCSDVDELRGLIETEVQKPNPNQSLIGYVNDRLEEVTD
jgi:hypothetical protein